MIIKCLTINTQVGGKINRLGQLAPNKFMPLKSRSDIIFSLNDCRRILKSCCLQKNNEMAFNFFLLLLGGGQDKPAWTACPPGVKITRVGGKISRDILPPGGQAVQGGKINCYTGMSSAKSEKQDYLGFLAARFK